MDIPQHASWTITESVIVATAVALLFVALFQTVSRALS